MTFDVVKQWLILLKMVTSYVQASDFTELHYCCIAFQIKMLLKKIICCKETLNLVVVPCNVDIATTEALRMAQDVDPSGERTLGEAFLSYKLKRSENLFFLQGLMFCIPHQVCEISYYKKGKKNYNGLNKQLTNLDMIQ